MPVVGHAFMGWTTAELAEGVGAFRPTVLSTPALIAAAYLPDIASFVGLTLGVETSRAWSHSLVAAAIASPILGLALQRLLDTGVARGWALAAVSLGLHDTVDALHSADRMLFYPLSTLTLATHPLPGGFLVETALFGGLGVLAASWRRRRGVPWPGARPAVVTLVAVAIVALGTSRLREAREADADAAFEAGARGDYGAALLRLDSATRWPAPAKPGRIDYLRAEAYNGLKDRESAERYYLASLRKDPGYVYALADIVKFYVLDDESVEVRRSRAHPFLERLRRHDDPYARKIVALAESRLGLPR